ncbi:hypothetical protein [Symmachiella dynata]|uniref:hypothetical protein n=1 Tax=Symmachiella dynata TaxID=2527995 RepID=UPI00118CD412|nr:hypothetical protein [Symmachiella dynata]QDT51767.1 hypothetical protein Pan258_58590 [Symmachiella dynata]
MTLRSFGRAVSIQMYMLELVGYEFKARDMVRAEGGNARKRTIRYGLHKLRKKTKADFGYDPWAWHEFLVEHGDEFGYTHPYAFRGVAHAVQEALNDPEVVAALAELAKQ